MTKANDRFKHCTATDTYFKDLMLGGYYTHVVRQLANDCEAYWLIDLVFSHQTNGNANEVTSQQIPHSDFKFDMAVLWLIDGVLILPSEY
jgi:hypothetical protein